METLCVFAPYCSEDIVSLPLHHAWKTNWNEEGVHSYSCIVIVIS